MEGGKQKSKSKKVKKSVLTSNLKEEGKKSKRVDLHVKVKKAESNVREIGKEDIQDHQKKAEPLYIPLAKAEKDKIVLMWSGAIFFMAVIFICWVSIFKNSVSDLAATSKDVDSNFEPIDKIVEEFSNNFSSTTEQIKVLGTLAKQLEKDSASTTITSDQNSEVLPKNNVNLSDEDLNKIKEEIINLKNNSENK